MEESDEVVVLYEYTAQLPDELNLKVGDVVTKVERMDGGWWQGELAGKRGMFPDNFVKVGYNCLCMGVGACSIHWYDWIASTKPWIFFVASYK